MAVEGVSHITLIVRDLERSSHLVKSVLGAQEIYASDERRFSLSGEKFFLLGDVWLALMEGSSPSERSYNHIAFKIPEEEYERFKDRLVNAGVEFREGRPRVPGEGRSLYFYDFDDHLLELHTGTLLERLQTYALYPKES